MHVGVVGYTESPSGFTHTKEAGMSVSWRSQPADAIDAIKAVPVDALLLLVHLDLANEVSILSRSLLGTEPATRLFLACSNTGQYSFLAEVTATYGPDVIRATSGALLTGRQSQVLAEIQTGMTNREIANSLGVSLSTINRHVEHILVKLGARNRTQAAAFGSRGNAPRN